MTAQFTQQLIQKEYTAILRGHAAKGYKIDYPLAEIQDKYTDTKARKGKPPQQASNRIALSTILSNSSPRWALSEC